MHSSAIWYLIWIASEWLQTWQMNLTKIICISKNPTNSLQWSSKAFLLLTVCAEKVVGLPLSLRTIPCPCGFYIHDETDVCACPHLWFDHLLLIYNPLADFHRSLLVPTVLYCTDCSFSSFALRDIYFHIACILLYCLHIFSFLTFLLKIPDNSLILLVSESPPRSWTG